MTNQNSEKPQSQSKSGTNLPNLSYGTLQGTRNNMTNLRAGQGRKDTLRHAEPLPNVRQSLTELSRYSKQNERN